MPGLIWAPAALADISRLHRFVASKNKDAAKRAVSAIRHGVKLLEQHPEAGRPLEDMPPEFREWAIEFGSGSYIVLYRFRGEDVIILAVRHSREAGY
ncbi:MULTISPECIES: type II toxin-antitoxin system RelE/ParE family toxin [Rhizobium/Agrobacterium group]|uniref:type II toxin-antitoxin system RelE/ParE family toxin n=1 Tax=Rhizobium/Agrobacterium group TaxID=227290 RepID=UPI000B3F6E2C|nr:MULTISPECIES: type II toxin-antitoxin system RelE/ParE family toxin [Rhizobium/Agrobacterium group]MCF1482909.1 type II toxin-antitoxin system RelE/ParE family toxin [Allorhizobium ampelinum]NSZ43448.1 type II toxin-antitoxin system RelE/ParE family toxin [Agrobacterium vitis]NTA27105.1 type II toxin-antitoxin system RelE/ParE family toxin [Allorhizobium ampelinum]OVE94189.1 plasmid stabilization protein [Allorhizobium ampelinum]